VYSALDSGICLKAVAARSINSEIEGDKTMVRGLLKAFILTGALVALYGMKAENNNDDFNTVGRQTLAKIQSQFRAEKQAHGAMRILDMTESCKKLPLVGKSVEQANKILRAAGQKSDLSPNTGPASKPNELVGGLVLENDGFAYSAVFNIILKTSKLKGGTIDSVIYCNVLTRSL
jgi:hypothetical protein